MNDNLNLFEFQNRVNQLINDSNITNPKMNLYHVIYSFYDVNNILIPDNIYNKLLIFEKIYEKYNLLYHVVMKRKYEYQLTRIIDIPNPFRKNIRFKYFYFYKNNQNLIVIQEI